MGAFKGRYAQIVALMCCMAAATIGVAQNTCGVFYSPVADDLGIMRGTYSFFGTAQALSVALSALAVPSLLRRFGIKWVVLLSMVCMGVPTVVLAFADSLPVIYACGALRGFGAALCANIPITMIINNWFVEANGTATSIALSFSGLAGAIFSPILTWFITHFDWRIAYLVQAALIVALMMPPLLVRLSVFPTEEGLAPFGANGAAKPGAAAAQAAGPGPKVSYTDAPFLLTALFLFLFCLVTGLAQHIAGYATSLGFKASFGALLLSLSMVGNICFKLIIGILADRFGAIKASATMIIANLVAMVLILVGARSHTGWMMVAGAVCYGSVYAVCAVGIALITRLFFGDGAYARVFPKISFVGSVGCAIAIPAIGYVYDFTGGYDLAVITCSIVDICSFALLFVAWKAARATYGHAA